MIDREGVMEFNLVQWPDGTIHLTHEDYLHGQDIDIILSNTGLAAVVTYDEKDENHTIISDLVHYLRGLATTPPPPQDTETPPEEA